MMMEKGCKIKYSARTSEGSQGNSQACFRPRGKTLFPIFQHFLYSFIFARNIAKWIKQFAIYVFFS